MRVNRLSIIFIVLLFASISIVSPVSSQEEQYPADINAQIIGDIPSVAISNWTEIEIEIKDAFGIDWGKLSEMLPEWWMKLFWPLNPAFPQPVQRFLGPTSFKLEPEIIQGDPNGWYTKISPTNVGDSLTGDSHRITLSVQADDAYLDNSVVIGIKVTRIDTLGGVIGHSYVYVPVKASPTNFIKMRTLEESTKEAPLKSLVYFTLDIVNEGFYRDVFEFEIEEENGLMALMDQQAVTIHPGETKRVTLEILTPEKLYDQGTPNELKIYVRSSGDETKTLVGNLVVITKGIYISPLVGIIAAPIIALLVIGYIGFALYKDKQDKELYGKPDKPWNIPAEQKHLQELKKKDAEEYQKVLDLMKQEYQSAILSWKSIQGKRKSSFLSSKVFSSNEKESKKKEDTLEKGKSKTKDEEGEKPFFKKGKKSKKPKEERVEKEDCKESKEKKTFEESSKEPEKTKPSRKKEESASNKLVKGLKKWFTVPKEEKQKKQDEPSKPEKKQEEPELKEDRLKEVNEDKTKKDNDSYEQELKGIEEDQKKKQAKKAEQQNKLEKQKAIDRVKKAQEKQRKKLKK